MYQQLPTWTEKEETGLLPTDWLRNKQLTGRWIVIGSSLEHEVTISQNDFALPAPVLESVTPWYSPFGWSSLLQKLSYGLHDYKGARL